MNRKDCFQALEERFPRTLSAAWDNDGVMCCDDLATPVSRVLCTLDVTDDAVRYAARGGFDLILSHHPLIFGGLSALHEEEPVARRVLSLLSSRIAVFSFHTRLDAAEGGINDALAALFELSDVAPLGDGEAALGRLGTLPAPMDIEAFAELVKQRLGTPALNVWETGAPVHRLALVGGEGKDMIAAAVAAGADTYLSGRLGYHAMQDAPISLVEAGHYYTERHAARLLADALKAVIPDAYTEIYAQNPLAVY